MGPVGAVADGPPDTVADGVVELEVAGVRCVFFADIDSVGVGRGCAVGPGSMMGGSSLHADAVITVASATNNRAKRPLRGVTMAHYPPGPEGRQVAARAPPSGAEKERHEAVTRPEHSLC
jgi:hypothetical protein